MTRFQRLALITAVATYILVVIGAIVRGTDSGMGCPDWPLCHGQLIPSTTDYHPWLEWFHRFIAMIIGFLALGVAVLAWRGYRKRRSILWPSLIALVVVMIQAALGAVTVAENNAGDTVTAHLATAMILLGILVYVAIRARYPDELPVRGASQRFTLLAALAAASIYALLLFGSHVTATGAALIFPDWPLFNGALIPSFGQYPAEEMAQFLHRAVTVVAGIILLVTAWAAMRQPRSRRGPVVAMIHTAVALFILQIFVGAAQIFTSLADWAVALHVALAAAIWALTLGAAIQSYYLTRLEGRPTTQAGGEPVSGTGGSGTRGGERTDLGPAGLSAFAAEAPAADATAGWAPAAEAPAGSPREVVTDLLERAPFTPAEAPIPAAGVGIRWRARIGAYVALTKPRIIELLLVTTVPAMVLATRDVPGIQVGSWIMLVIATLIGGALAAGSANAINCYIDRDIDELMTRTRRRPLPAHAVDPENALVFGLALGVLSFAWLTIFANLLAAFLALLAIAFYVVVYTLLLKRSTPQNIVIGGAAGALPPVIGWAAVTGNVALPALFLFLIVFYWTPPHFWALALRLSRDYEAAGVPMLPVVKGVRETNRQIVLYTVLLVVLTLAFALVAGMGLVYTAGAAILGALFLRQAWMLWREGTGAGAVRLYRFSITYLTVLFALIALDVLLPIAL
jgi:protoheme IX farnesyltransferase